MCCPEIIYVERKSNDYIVIKKYGIASEIWMRDTKKEAKVCVTYGKINLIFKQLSL